MTTTLILAAHYVALTLGAAMLMKALHLGLPIVRRITTPKLIGKPNSPFMLKTTRPLIAANKPMAA